MAILVGRVVTPVIQSSGTQLVDQGRGKKTWNCKEIAQKVVEAGRLTHFHLVTTIRGLTPLRSDKDLGISVETGMVSACPGVKAL